MASRKSRMSTFLRDERGATGTMFALAIVPAIAMAGGAVDYGNALSQRTLLQTATDAAASAANLPADVSLTERQAIAMKVFRANVAGTQHSAATPTVSATDTSVTVELSRRITTPFLALAGVTHVDVLASSTASGSELVATTANAKVCLLALDPESNDGIHLQGGNIVNYADCWSHTNSTKATAINANGNNAQANGLGHCAVGGWTQSHATFTPSPTAGCTVVPDPFATVGAYETGAYTSTFTPPSKAITCKANNLNLKKGTFTLDPGRYCGGINIQAHATVTFNPGIYYIDNGALNVQSGSSVTGSNVLFYLEGAASKITVIGGGTVNLSGRTTTATYAGFLFIAHPNANPTGESNIQGGGTFKLNGMLYMPKQRIEVAGNGDVNTEGVTVFGMVARDFYFRGNGVFNLKKHAGTGNVPDIMPNLPVLAIRRTVLSD